MYEIRVKDDFSAAHNLRNYKGKCEKLHGHNWFVEAAFAFVSLDKEGLAMDFRKAKMLLKQVLGRLDHAYLNNVKPFTRTNPTSENIARFVYDKIKQKNNNIKSVTVWENENACATYSEA